MGHQRHSGLVAGIAILLCLACAGCGGFFIDPTISSIFITPSAATISGLGNTQQLTASANYSDGSQSKLTSSSVGWSSSNTAVATVTNGGLVTGVSFGTATITASDQGVNGTSTISVTPQNVTTIAITTTQGSTNPQSTATISGVPNALQFYAYANLSSSQDITDAVTWKSSNTNVATISTGLSSGLNGIAKSVAAGTTVITASTTSSGVVITSNTITLTVQ